MRHYYDAMGEDPFSVLPLTFFCRKGLKDPEFSKFTGYYQGLEMKIRNMNLEQDRAVKEAKEKAK